MQRLSQGMSNKQNIDLLFQRIHDQTTNAQLLIFTSELIRAIGT